METIVIILIIILISALWMIFGITCTKIGDRGEVPNIFILFLYTGPIPCIVLISGFIWYRIIKHIKPYVKNISTIFKQ